jgi:hypothetical protein
MAAGQERVMWNPALTLPAKEFEFSDPEAARIKAAIESCDAYGVSERPHLSPQLSKRRERITQDGSTDTERSDFQRAP